MKIMRRNLDDVMLDLMFLQLKIRRSYLKDYEPSINVLYIF